jgi:4-hydroxy-tetrahydrodipicolinate synthase
MLTGLSAFPLTPIADRKVDETAFIRLVENLVAAGVDSIGALGSTGSYAYLTTQERVRLTRLAVDHAGATPVMVSIGSIRLEEVLELTDAAQQAGVSAVMMAPVSYQRLKPDEVFALYDTVTRHLSVPLCIYDNPGTTGFHFSDDLLAEVAALPSVGSVKLSTVAGEPLSGKARVEALRARISEHVSIGISGDWQAAEGFAAGCDIWYSVMGGLFPAAALALTRVAQTGDHESAAQASARLEPLWQLFRQHGSLRVVAAAASILGLAQSPCLPFPLQELSGAEKNHLSTVLESLALV